MRAHCVTPPPREPATWRYRVGDILLFTAAFFNAQPGGLNGLEAPQLRRDRTGIIRTRTRERHEVLTGVSISILYFSTTQQQPFRAYHWITTSMLLSLQKPKNRSEVH